MDPENMALSLSMYIRETILTRWARQQISCFIAFCKKNNKMYQDILHVIVALNSVTYMYLKTTTYLFCGFRVLQQFANAP